MNIKHDNTGCSVTLGWVHRVFGIITAMIGYRIHNSIGWAIIDFFFFPLAWIKWLILHQVNLTIIKQTFAFFLQ
jgi:hypothetical protein